MPISHRAVLIPGIVAIHPLSHTTNVHPVKVTREEFLAQYYMTVPSNSGVSPSFRMHRECQVHGISCARFRSSCATIPLALLHPVFGEFADDCWSCETTIEDLTFAQRCAYIMLDIPDEEVRREKINKVFTSYYGTNTTIASFEADGDLCVNRLRYLIVEIKNELSNTNCEPYFQLLSHYLESTRETAIECIGSTLPCFLVVLAGR